MDDRTSNSPTTYRQGGRTQVGASSQAGDGSGQGSPGGGGLGKTRRRPPIWKELPVLVVIALGLALLIKTFLIQAFYIPSGSMENTLQVNDRVLVNKLSYRFGEVERGDVVVFSGADSWEPEVVVPPPANALDGFLRKVSEVFGFSSVGEKDFIKRVVAVGGDKVKCCDSKGRVSVNGKTLQEQDYLFPGDRPSATPFESTVPKDHLWVMGDHRSASADSRAHTGSPGGGAIPVDHVIGRAFIIVWPMEHWGTLSRPSTFEQTGLSAAGPYNGANSTTAAALGLGLPVLVMRLAPRLRRLRGPRGRDRRRE